VSDDERPSGPTTSIAEKTFSGVVQMSVSDQEQIAASLRQRVYSGTLDGVTDEVLERVREEWQNRGYFKVKVSGGATTLTSSPVSQRIALSVDVDEGVQYKLGGITFEHNKALADVNALRGVFPINDGDIFSREKIATGLENLRKAYGGFGYINFTSIPNTKFDDEGELIHVDIDCDEGKQFYLSGINVLGLDDHGSQDVVNDFFLKPGEVYNQRLVELSLKHLSVPQSSAFRSYQLQRDEKAGTVAITISFGYCLVE